MPVIEFP
jgi:predicted aspartyl protease